MTFSHFVYKGERKRPRKEEKKLPQKQETCKIKK
jgi:hypothetical protein